MSGLINAQTEKIIKISEKIYTEAKEQWQQEFIDESMINNDEEHLLKIIEEKPKMLVKWEKRLIKLKEIKAHLKFESDKLYALLYKKLMIESDINFSQREIDKQIRADENYIKILKGIEKCDIIISEIESFLNYIKNSHWDIKNMIEIKKLIYGAST